MRVLCGLGWSGQVRVDARNAWRAAVQRTILKQINKTGQWTYALARGAGWRHDRGHVTAGRGEIHEVMLAWKTTSLMVIGSTPRNLADT